MHYWPEYGLEMDDKPLDFQTVFQREAPVTVEIGFGMGDQLLHDARNKPDELFIGIDVHEAGVAKVLTVLHDEQISNTRLYCHDAVDVFAKMIPDSSVSRINIFFPDPWHKKRHNKRRLIQPDFVALIIKTLIPGGLLHLATDWEDYAEQMLAVLMAEPQLENTAAGYAPRPADRCETKFEKRGQRLGHGVWDLLFRKTINDII